MKKALILLAVIGLSASLGAQSVAELAKREKARREALRGRHAVVIKNADLLRVQKAPAVEVTNPDEAVGEAALDEAQDVQPATAARRITPRVSADGPTIMGEGESVDLSSSEKTLDAQLKAATDLVDLLTTKMNALRQQYEYQDAMVPGYVIQQQIDETNQRLLKAQAQQARIQAEFDKRGAGKKDPGSPGR
ncbi:MAG: hypothetical protein A2V76_02360 [Candidatus Aminicenantes bacterium RBG_16_63_14]|nr:MAG: hypothetical protein A2V76_02360 [Candidatus Aminicenantes bacterium RBG_16_63_14]OGD29062.1 MAG: hypothetical protein A2V57_05410 [Candidatus Aminicenantes bacterium RBG_19FT_COMBO_65_30]